VADGLGAQKYITADRADFCWNSINDDHLAAVTDSLRHESWFALARAAFNSALQRSLLWLGVFHFGGRGSYTVIITKTGRAVVQTMCRGRPARVVPLRRQQAPRRWVE
jgi:hypothetical protein